jgi:hypothetical protein
LRFSSSITTFTLVFELQLLSRVLMALRRVPAPDLLRATIRQPLLDSLPPAGHCFISFRAGIMERVDGKLRSDKRRGQVAIVRNDAGATAVLWFERVFSTDDEPQAFTLAEEADIDVMIFDFEAEFFWMNKERRVLKLSFKEVSAVAAEFCPFVVLCIACWRPSAHLTS